MILNIPKKKYDHISNPQLQFFTARTRVPKTAHGFSKPKEASRRKKGRFEALYANCWPWIQNAI